MTESERKALASTYAEDRNRAMERATEVFDDLGFAMSDALLDWVTRDEGRTARIRRVVANALFLVYRSKRRPGDVAAALAPALVGYTTAPEDYDHDYVKTVETFTVPDIGGKRDSPWRKIEVYDIDRFLNFQVPRYRSGFHAFAPNDPRMLLVQEEDVPVRHGRYEVQRAERWRNLKTGETAATRGAVPWTRPDESNYWYKEDLGWTVYDTVEGTYGSGRKPFSSKAEAQNHANQRNEEWEKIQKRQQETAWYFAGQTFVDDEIGKEYAKKRKKGYKPSYTDHERFATLEVMREILALPPSRDTEERFKSMKLTYLSKRSSKGRE